MAKKEADPRQRDPRALADLGWVLGDARGRRFVWRLLGICRTFSNIMAPAEGVAVSERLLWNAGRHDLGIGLYNECLCADDTGRLYGLMAHEAHNAAVLAKPDPQARKLPEEEDEPEDES